ncbi:MAG: hypothetical protein IJQ65_07340 [Kiritimatiellae bacterium]|nr:hypothetical protein [Kiritimatiellia bacterium]
MTQGGIAEGRGLPFAFYRKSVTRLETDPMVGMRNALLHKKLILLVAVGVFFAAARVVVGASTPVDAGSRLQVLWDDHVVDFAEGAKLSEFEGVPVVVEFDLYDADIYSFRFTAKHPMLNMERD